METGTDEDNGSKRMNARIQSNGSNNFSILFPCEHCSETFNSFLDLKSHEKVCCGKNKAEKGKPNVVKSKTKVLVKVISNKAPVHNQEVSCNKCGICNKTYPNPYVLRRHKRTHLEDKPHKCPECSYSCKKPSFLRLHIAKWHSGIDHKEEDGARSMPQCETNHFNSEKKTPAKSQCEKSSLNSEKKSGTPAKPECQRASLDSEKNTQTLETPQCEEVSSESEMNTETPPRPRLTKTHLKPKKKLLLQSFLDVPISAANVMQSSSPSEVILTTSQTLPDITIPTLRPLPTYLITCVSEGQLIDETTISPITIPPVTFTPTSDPPPPNRSPSPQPADSPPVPISTPNQSPSHSDFEDKEEEAPIKYMILDEPGEYFGCSRCKYIAQNVKELRKHVRRIHGEKRESCAKCKDKAESKEGVKENTCTCSKIVFPCEFCPYETMNRSHFWKHMRTHKGIKTYPCTYCDYKATESATLKKHIRRHTGERPYSCSLCDYKGRARSSIAQHMKTHCGDKPWACTECPFRSTQKNNLVVHMRSHTGEKPYMCSDCGFRTGYPNTFKRHKILHSGKVEDRPHPCTVCDARYTTLFAWTEHMRTHTGEKPFACDKCPFRATRKRLLDSHLQTHMDRMHACKLCEFKTNQKSYLRKHMRKHTGEKPYACELCECKFSNGSGLSYHYKTHHDESNFVSCDHCEFRSTRSEVKKHRLETHFDTVYSCGFCSYQHEKKKVMNAHVKCVHLQKDTKRKRIRSRKKKSPETELDLESHSKNQKSDANPIPQEEWDTLFSPEIEEEIDLNSQKETCLIETEEVQDSHLITLIVNADQDQIQYTVPYSEDPTSVVVFDNNCSEPPSSLESPSPIPQSEQQSLKLSSPTDTLESKTSIIPPTTNPLQLTPTLTNNQPLVLLPSKFGYVLACAPPSQPTTTSKPNSSTATTAASSLPLLVPKPTIQLPSTLCSFLCPTLDCSHKAVDITSLELDLKTHPSVKEKPVYSCDQCERKYHIRAQLKVHMRLHTNEKPYSCDQCAYRSRYRLRQHLLVHTKMKPFACRRCPFKTACKSNLRRHMRTHTGIKRYECNYCGLRTTEKDSLNNHIKRRHTKEKPFSCTLCDFKSVTKSSITIHMRTHTKEKPYACTFCEYRANLRNNLVEHLRKHTGEKPYLCSICGFKTGLRGVITLHTQRHKGIKPHQCTQCEARFVTKFSLKKHMRVHTGEKPFPCSLCEAKFTKKTALQRHTVVHTGGSVFSCSHCGFKTYRKALLSIHEKTHTEKSLSCEVFDFATDSQSQLDAHARNLVGEEAAYTLSEEGLIVPVLSDDDTIKSSRSGVEKHILVKKVFSCPLCGYQCDKKSLLSVHMEQNHSGDSSL